MMKKILSILLVLMMLPVCSLAEEWVCPQCGRTNTGNFCTQDAQPRPEDQVCSACGTVNDSDAKYCSNCANPLGYVVGNIVTFGTYAGESIQWKVLEDKGNGTYVLLSEYGLEAKAYNEEYVDVTWETCTLRSWLNGEFYQTAFTDKERAQILLTDVVNADNAEYGTEGGNDTQDYVYLLSLDEVQRYFGDRLDDFGCCEDLICMPTQHAVDSGASTLSADWIKEYLSDYSYEFREGECEWWLRSPGYLKSSTAYVLFGIVSSNGTIVGFDNECVRPVIVVQLS